MKPEHVEVFEGLGSIVRSLRELSGLSPQALANSCRDLYPKSCMTAEMVSDWEGGWQLPSLEELGQVLGGLGRYLIELHQGLEAAEREAKGRLASGTDYRLRALALAEELTKEHAEVQRLNGRILGRVHGELLVLAEQAVRQQAAHGQKALLAPDPASGAPSEPPAEESQG